MVCGMLAACSSNSPRSGSICPTASVIYGLERAELALGPPPSPNEAPPILSFRLGPLIGSCTVASQTVVAEYDLGLTLSNRSRTDLDDLTASFFIVVLAPDGSVLDKSVFDVGPIDLVAGGLVSLPQSFQQTITLAPDTVASRYEILAGFQLPTDVATRQRREF